ncbi:MAG: [Fe-Fe] hydrogenase large subunit C-terminal domain-containing protein [Cellulosilyticaceae bacterium]
MYSHSVTLESSKCIGCTDCIKRCPTEAIRVKNAKAKIIQERCIDCGNCIAICRNGAKQAVMAPLSSMSKYAHRIAMPAPAFYAQFSKCERIETILESLYDIGFTDVVEVAYAAEAIALGTKAYLKEAKAFPVISSACPVIARLIQRRFPSLIDHILPLMSPMELAARYIKLKYAEKGIPEDEIGVFFISPCPAKGTDIHKPKGFDRSYVDGALSMQEVYKAMVHQLKYHKDATIPRKPIAEGMSWAMRNGAVANVGIDNHIAVDGMDSVIHILEKVEDGTLSNIQYIEALACTGGCLGGALTIENPFVSRYTLKKFMDHDQKHTLNEKLDEKLLGMNYRYERLIDPKPVFSLDDNLAVAIGMMEQIEALYKRLPQIDCGSCGAPTCQCFAEDVVKGFSNEEDCVFMLKERIKALSQDMLELTQKFLPTQEKK